MAGDWTTDALVLRTVPFGEADLVVHALLEEGGRTSAFARSARRSSRRIRGGMPLFALLRWSMQRRSEDAMPAIRESEVIRTWRGLSADLVRLAVASIVLELLDRTLPDREGAEQLGRAVRFFDWLDAEPPGSPRIEGGLHRFQLRLAIDLGICPDLERCARSGRPIAELERPRWVPDGGIIDESTRHPGEGSVALDPESVAYLTTLLAGRFPRDVAQGAHADALFRAIWVHLIGRPLHTWTLWDQARQLAPNG